MGELEYLLSSKNSALAIPSQLNCQEPFANALSGFWEHIMLQILHKCAAVLGD